MHLSPSEAWASQDTCLACPESQPRISEMRTSREGCLAGPWLDGRMGPMGCVPGPVRMWCHEATMGWLDIHPTHRSHHVPRNQCSLSALCRDEDPHQSRNPLFLPLPSSSPVIKASKDWGRLSFPQSPPPDPWFWCSPHLVPLQAWVHFIFTLVGTRLHHGRGDG